MLSHDHNDHVAFASPPGEQGAPVAVIETDRRLSQSVLWDLQRRYFAEAGISAWSTSRVPHYVTSNPALAHAYAAVFLGFLRDLHASGLDVIITSPKSGSLVGGRITVKAKVTISGSPTMGVQFRLDGAHLGPEDTAAPYSTEWNTLSTPQGWHVLTAVARDSAGATATSWPVIVKVFNTTSPPSVSITAPGAGATVSGMTTIGASGWLPRRGAGPKRRSIYAHPPPD